MKRQIISRAFYGWLAYCRHLSTVRTHLSGMVHGRITPDIGAENGLNEERWQNLHDENGVITDDNEFYRLVYFGGVAQNIRKEVWPYLLGHHSFGQTPQERLELDENTKHYYETTMSEWLAVEAIVRQRDKEKTAVAVAKLSSGGSGSDSKVVKNGVDLDVEMENEVFEENGFSDLSDPEVEEEDCTKKSPMEENLPEERADQPPVGESIKSSPSSSSYETVGTDFVDTVDTSLSPKKTSVIVTNASIDIVNMPALLADDDNVEDLKNLDVVNEETPHISLDALKEPKSACASPASSNGGIYSVRISHLQTMNSI